LVRFTSPRFTILLTLTFSRVTSKEASNFKLFSSIRRKLKKCTSDTKTDSTSLTRNSAAFYVDFEIIVFIHFKKIKWLENDVTACRFREVVLNVTRVDRNFTRPFRNVYASYC